MHPDPRQTRRPPSDPKKTPQPSQKPAEAPQSLVIRLHSQMGSTLGLLVVLFVFTFVGAIIFQFIEQPNEYSIKFELKKERRAVLDAVKKVVKNEKQITAITKQLDQYRDTLLDAFSQGVTSDSRTATKWTFWGSVFYCLTVYTTIGYGNIAPTTTLGRLLTIVYSLIGIPLCLIVLARLGKVFTKTLRTVWVYPRLRFARADVIAKLGQSTAIQSIYNTSDECFNFSFMIASLITVMYMLFGVLLYRMWEPWGYVDAAYFIFVSLSTIGFGDVLPEQSHFFLLSSMYIFVGLALVSMLLTMIQEEMERRVPEKVTSTADHAHAHAKTK